MFKNIIVPVSDSEYDMIKEAADALGISAEVFTAVAAVRRAQFITNRAAYGG